MARFMKGDVVVIPFPFSDLTQNKKRPAFVLANLPGDDIILCQITSQFKKDKFIVELNQNDFITGSLPVQSFIRPDRIFTADKKIIIRKVGSSKKEIIDQVVDKLVSLLKT